MNTDRLSSIETGLTSRGVFVLLDTTDQFPREYQLACPAVLLLALCDAYKLDPGKVMEVARNWIADKRNGRDERMQALDFYIKRNILGQKQ